MGNIKWTQERLEEFVLLWQSTETIQELIDKFSVPISDHMARNQATLLRKQGVPLEYKYRKHTTVTINYDKLARLAKKE